MFEAYQSYKIVIYYTPETKEFLGWAKAFWLLKTAHPIIETPIINSPLYSEITELHYWITNLIPSCKEAKALFVPATLRSLVDIDLVIDSNKTNRFSVDENNFPIICRHNTDEINFIKTETEGVFEDLSKNLQKIKQETLFMQKELLMNV